MHYIDLDTGTVLGTNLVLVNIPDEELEDILSSDSYAREYGAEHGIPVPTAN